MSPRTPDVLVRDLFETIDGRNWHNLHLVFTSDAVYERPGYEPLIGLDRILRFYQIERIIAEGHHHIDHVTASASAVACWGHFEGASRTGQTLNERFADTYSLSQGMIALRRTYFYRPAI